MGSRCTDDTNASGNALTSLMCRHQGLLEFRAIVNGSSNRGTKLAFVTQVI